MQKEIQKKAEMTKLTYNKIDKKIFVTSDKKKHYIIIKLWNNQEYVNYTYNYNILIINRFAPY